MKTKNLNFAEKHIEKVVLAVAILFSLYVIYEFLIANPYAIEVNNRTMTPDEVGRQMVREAENLKVGVSKTDLPDEIAQAKPPAYVPAFEKRMNTAGRVADMGELQYVFGQPGLDLRDVDVKPPDAVPYIEPVVPPVLGFELAQDNFVIREPDPINLRQWERIGLPPTRPRDVRAVTVSASFPLARWVEQLQEKQGMLEAIPESWWRNRVGLVEIVLERQERTPDAPTWSRATVIPTFPSYEPIATLDERVWQAENAIATVRELIDRQHHVIHPPFAPLAIGQWLPADVDLDNLDERRAARVEEILARIQTLQSQAQEEMLLQIALARPQPPRAGQDDQPPAGDANNPAGPAGEQADPNARPGAGPGANENDRDAGFNKTETLVDIEARLAQLHTELMEALGYWGGSQEELPDTITVMAHDISPRPGMYYRYRMRIAVINPLFQQLKLNEEQKARHFNRIALLSAFSDWSDQIQIDPRFEFFLAQGQTQTSPAKVEIFTTFNGRVVGYEFEVRPGDPIGGRIDVNLENEPRVLDMKLDWVVVDIEGSRDATRMIALDRLTGDLLQRSLGTDQNDPVRLQRVREAERGFSAGGAPRDTTTAFSR